LRRRGQRDQKNESENNCGSTRHRCLLGWLYENTAERVYATVTISISTKETARDDIEPSDDARITREIRREKFFLVEKPSDDEERLDRRFGMSIAQ
jgi:hypothetical protein